MTEGEPEEERGGAVMWEIFSINSNYIEYVGAWRVGGGGCTSEPLQDIMTSTKLSLECSCV